MACIALSGGREIDMKMWKYSISVNDSYCSVVFIRAYTRLGARWCARRIVKGMIPFGHCGEERIERCE